DYRRREDATTELMTAGPNAIDAVAKAARVEDVETAYRAVRILQAFSDRNDNQIQQRAVTALESLAADENEATADLAADALAFYHLTLQDRSIDQLKQLGAAVRQVRDGDPMFMALELDPTAAEAVLDSRWSGKAADFELLKKIPNLQRLRLVNVTLDEAALKTVGELSHLKQLDLFGTNVSPEDKQSLERAIAGMAIDYRKGAKLGIGGNKLAVGCTIQFVEAESAAAVADVQAGDEVLKIDGRSVGSFEEFTSLISDKKGGEKIELEIRRGEDTQVKSITLGSWR
ncbi:MAG TPA: PDZ domain-containing protein, partial [Pirellulales bacterium]